MKIVKNGITVSTNSNLGKFSYNVEIVIPKYLLKSHIFISYESHFKLNFYLKRTCLNDVIIKFTVKYKTFNNLNLIDTKSCSNFSFENEYYKCNIVLCPKMYITSKVNKRNKKIKQQDSKYSSIHYKKSINHHLLFILIILTIIFLNRIMVGSYHLNKTI